MAGEDRISALPDDLLLKILSQVPAKYAVTTMILSKRWSLVWTMMPKLEFNDTSKKGEKGFWCLLDKSLQLHKATVLESLRILVDHQFPDDADVGKWVSYAVDHCVRELALLLPSRLQFLLLPRNVYNSNTLVKLTLACNSLVVDVPSLSCLPSLQSLALIYVIYKDQNSHVRLLSSCPALRYLFVFRNICDNVTRFIVKVPSLKSFTYRQHITDFGTSLVLDSPGLRDLSLRVRLEDYGSIQNMPHLDKAVVRHVGPHPNDKFLASFSSVRILHLSLSKLQVACCSGISFPRLIVFKLHLYCSDYTHCSLEPLMLFLHNSPLLKVLRINYDVDVRYKDLPVVWNQPSSVPGCLLSHLEIFGWKEYGGGKQEKEFVAYIFANSKCLKTARISPRCSYNLQEKEKMMEELESMYRVSASSQLLPFSQIAMGM